jgi:hypothetical protein
MLYDVHAAIENYGTKRDAVTGKRRTTMLDLSFDDEDIMIWVTPNQIIPCDVCGHEAYIFQDEGNFCLECWQERTEPYITVNRACIEP